MKEKIRVDVSGLLLFICFIVLMTVIYIKTSSEGVALAGSIGGVFLACFADIKITITKD